MVAWWHDFGVGMERPEERVEAAQKRLYEKLQCVQSSPEAVRDRPQNHATMPPCHFCKLSRGTGL